MANSHMQTIREQGKLIQELHADIEAKDSRIRELQGMYDVQGKALYNAQDRIASLGRQCASLEASFQRYRQDGDDIPYSQGPSLWEVLGRRRDPSLWEVLGRRSRQSDRATDTAKNKKANHD